MVISHGKSWKTCSTGFLAEDMLDFSGCSQGLMKVLSEAENSHDKNAYPNVQSVYNMSICDNVSGDG